MDEGTTPLSAMGQKKTPTRFIRLPTSSGYPSPNPHGTTNTSFKPVTSMPRRLRTGQMDMGSVRLEIITGISKATLTGREIKYLDFLSIDQEALTLLDYFPSKKR